MTRDAGFSHAPRVHDLRLLSQRFFDDERGRFMSIMDLLKQAQGGDGLGQLATQFGWMLVRQMS